MEPLEDRRMLSLTLHVDDDAASGGDGFAWGTAFGDLQAALSKSVIQGWCHAQIVHRRGERGTAVYSRRRTDSTCRDRDSQKPFLVCVGGSRLLRCAPQAFRHRAQ